MEEDIRNIESFRSWVRQILSKEIIQIEFAKTDGSLRVMNCTTSLALIPQHKHPVTAPDASRGTRWNETSGTAQTVFDMDKNEWRSFRWESFISLKFEIV
jgi:hypothetical protein